MNQVKINKILFKASRWSGYLLIFLIVLYFISGYGMTKGIIDPIFAKSLHEKWLPIPFVISIILHLLFPLKIALRKRIKDESWLNIYLIILSLVIFLIFLYFHLR